MLVGGEGVHSVHEVQAVCTGSMDWLQRVLLVEGIVELHKQHDMFALIVTGHVLSDVCMSEPRYSRLANGTVLFEAQHLDWTKEASISLVLKALLKELCLIWEAGIVWVVWLTLVPLTCATCDGWLVHTWSRAC